MEVQNYIEKNFFDPNLTEIVITGMGLRGELSGIKEMFPNLEKLCCEHNKIEKIKDLPESLKRLYCEENEIKDLDLSKNKNLEIIFCSGNKIKNKNKFLFNIPTARLEHLFFDVEIEELLNKHRRAGEKVDETILIKRYQENAYLLIEQEKNLIFALNFILSENLLSYDLVWIISKHYLPLEKEIEGIKINYHNYLVDNSILKPNLFSRKLFEEQF